MKKPLIDVIFASEKRKDILLLLQDGPKEMKFILEALSSSRQALLPQIRILEEHKLVSKIDDSYKLTKIGELIVEDMIPLLGKVSTFDTDVDYWGTRNLDFIPPHLLKRLDELEKCKKIVPSLCDLHSIQKNYHQASKKSKSLFVIATFFYPDYLLLFKELFDEGVDIHFIISSDLFDKLQKQDNTEFKKILQKELFHLFVYPYEMNLMSFGLNDECLMMRLLTKRNENDYGFFMCTGSSVYRWGKDLFEYYLKDSTPITEL